MPEATSGSNSVTSPNTSQLEPGKPGGAQTTGNAGKTSATKVAEPLTFTVKVNGVESQVGVSEAFPEIAEVWPTLSDAAKKRVITMHQKDAAASRRLTEAHAIKSQAMKAEQDAREILAYIKENPRAALSDPRLGVNVRKFAEEYLAQELQKEMMDPKDRELQDAKAERDRLLAKEKERAEAAEKEAEEKKINERAARLKDALATKINAVLKDSSLPANERTVAKIAYYMQQAIAKDIPLDIEEIRDQVTEDFKADFGHVLKSARPEQIVSIIGEGKLKELRQWDNERITGKKRKPEEEKGTLARTRAQMKKKFKTPEEDNLERFGSIYPNIQD